MSARKNDGSDVKKIGTNDSFSSSSETEETQEEVEPKESELAHLSSAQPAMSRFRARISEPYLSY